MFRLPVIQIEQESMWVMHKKRFSGFRKYVFRHILRLLFWLAGITFLSFVMMGLAGSDVVLQQMEGRGTVLSQELIDQARAELGLDRPMILQYLSWLGNLCRGDLGTSYVSGQGVFSVFVSKLPATLLLAGVSMALTMVISVPLGILAAVKKNRFVDQLIRVCSFVGGSLPNFFLALLFLYVFSIRLNMFPVISREKNLESVMLPALTLAGAMSSRYISQVRAAVLDEFGKEYITGIMARGVPFRRILWNSVFRGALPSLIALFSLSFGSLLGGTAIVESIFMWDGVGKLAVDAMKMRDYPVIQAYVLWMAVIYTGVNLVADLVSGILDPRIRLGGIADED